ncbi:MAG: MBL fold metallo-hydrolase [Alistipes sp.]|nr:MBL fold metallo-hydrolase [Alistipes sp.]
MRVYDDWGSGGPDSSGGSGGLDDSGGSGSPSGSANPNISGGSEVMGGPDGSERLDIVIDAGPDFRAQMLAADVRKLDGILMTHEHKDHTGGLDDIRAYNYFAAAPVDIWATERVQGALRRDYAYAFDERPYPGAPEITLHTIDDGRDADGTMVGNGKPFCVKGIVVTPIRGLHMRLPVVGFRMGGLAGFSGFSDGFGDSGFSGGSVFSDSLGGGLAYLTDFNHIDEGEMAKLHGLDTLVINALGHKAHISHFNLEQAVEVARKVGARRTYLTHISHRMGLYADIEPTLPEGIHLAYDGLTIRL